MEAFVKTARVSGKPLGAVKQSKLEIQTGKLGGLQDLLNQSKIRTISFENQ